MTKRAKPSKGAEGKKAKDLDPKAKGKKVKGGNTIGRDVNRIMSRDVNRIANRDVQNVADAAGDAIRDTVNPR